MIVCRGAGLSRHYSQDPVFSDLTFQIEDVERIGLVGPNGAGKTTLMRVLALQDQPDSGQLTFHPEVRVASLAQFPNFDGTETLIGETRKALAHLEAWHDEMVEAGKAMATTEDPIEHNRQAKRFDELQERLRRHGGYEFQYRIEEVLHGLGFKDIDFERPLKEFSGGQLSRVALAKLLLASPDLMLLDEPTNHLDITTTEWLENFLSRQQTAMVIVSHDRFFLDKTVTHIWEMFDGGLTEFPGSYSDYMKLRTERQKANARTLEKQQTAIAHHTDFVRKNLSGQLAKQAKSREKMIARIESELVDKVRDIQGPTMGYGEVTRTGDIVFTANELAKSYDRPVFAGFTHDILRGEKVGVIGPNGAGKTTLMKILVGEMAPTSGETRLGHQVRVGVLDQHLSILDPEDTPIDAVRPPWKAGEKAESFRGLLARFGIGADLIEQKIKTLSGGERTRVALARMRAYEFNVLAFDEPTNHLDLWARESLERTLKDFEGTILVVSHDRYFLNNVVDKLLCVDGGKVKAIAGNYDKYVEWRDEQQRLVDAATKKTAKPAAQTQDAPKRRKRKYPYRKADEIEVDIGATETKLSELEANLLLPEVYKDGRRVKQVNEEIAAAKTKLQQLMEHWEESMELNS